MAKKQIILVGGEQEGKTFWAENLCNSYNESGKTALIYNVGRDEDFSKYDTAFVSESGNLLIDSEEITIEKVPVLFQGKGVRVFRESEPRIEKLFFSNIGKYLFNSIFVTDDARAVYGDRYKPFHTNLFSRKSHAGMFNRFRKELGMKTGIDTVQMNHSFDTITNEAFVYASDLIMFRTSVVPTLSHLKDNQLKEIIIKWSKLLKLAPKYTCVHIGVKGSNYLKVKESTIKL